MAKTGGFGNLRFMLRALAYPNYRLFFGGQIVSLIGTWLSTVAISWLVYRLTNDPAAPEKAALALGVVGFAGQIPIVLVSPFAGVWIDRWHRHRVLVATQTLAMLQSFALAALTLSDVITLGQIIVLSALQGLINAFDVPTRQAFVSELVERREDLGNAIALNSSMVHTARLVGPAVAGFLIYHFGEGICFLIDGCSYLAVIAALLAMRVPRAVAAQAPQRAVRALVEGLKYTFGFRPIRSILMLVAVSSLMTMSLTTLMPLFADRLLGGGERTLGLLLGAMGLGSLAGSLYLASRRSVRGLGRVIIVACAVLGTGLALFAASQSLVVALPLLLIIGVATVTQMAACNTILQSIVDDDKRGRVMSLYTIAFLGMAPFSNLLAGAVASEIGPRWTFGLAGVVCLIAAGLFALELPALRPLIRPIYQRKGILPEVAEGMQSAATMPTPQD